MSTHTTSIQHCTVSSSQGNKARTINNKYIHKISTGSRGEKKRVGGGERSGPNNVCIYE
jgi:hypothetical protein